MNKIKRGLRKAILGTFATRGYLEKKKGEYFTVMYYVLRDEEKLSKSEAINKILEDTKTLETNYEMIHSYIDFRTVEEELS